MFYMRELSSEETAWLAGIIEGEGCLVNRKDQCVVINVTMTDEDVVRRIHLLTGAGNVTGPYGPYGGAGKWSESYQWNCGKREEVVPLLRSIYPWLGERRQKRVDDLISIADRPKKSRWS